MTFFTNTEELKAYVGGAVNNSLDISSLEPKITSAYRNYLQPFVPAALSARFTTATQTPTLSPQEEAAKKLFLEALAHLAVYKYTFISGVQISDQGTFRAESDTHKTAYKYQTKEHRDSMEEDGMSALEALLIYLRTNRAALTAYIDSDEEEYAYSRIVNLAADFRAGYSGDITRVTFNSLLPIIEDVEQFALVPCLGQSFYDEMKEIIPDTDADKALKEKALRLMKRVVVNFAINEGIQRNIVQMQGNKILTAEILGDQGSEKRGIPTDNKLSITMRQADLTANRYVQELSRFLAENIDTFPTYKTHLDALAAAEEEEEESETYDNDTERYYPCGCHHYCNCRTDFHEGRGHTGGIVRF